MQDPFGNLGNGPAFYLYLNGALVGTYAAWVSPSAPVGTDPFALGGNSLGANLLQGSAQMYGWGLWGLPLNVYQVGLGYNGGTAIQVL